MFPFPVAVVIPISETGCVVTIGVVLISSAAVNLLKPSKLDSVIVLSEVFRVPPFSDQLLPESDDLNSFKLASVKPFSSVSA